MPIAAILTAFVVFTRVTVTGDSMRPALEPGDCLVVLRVGHRLGLRPGTLVTVRDPRPDAAGRLLVKRVADVGPGSVAVRGDNSAASTDSRSFGRLPLARVTGRVLYRYAPAGRTGLIR